MPSSSLAAVRARLLKVALAYPEAREEHPWGEQVIKVRGKIFVFVGVPEDGSRLTITAKLPRSGAVALSLPFAQPCGYGLGKSGWVTARFARGDDVPEPLLLEWIEESWRAVAPKKLVAARDGGAAPSRAPRQEPAPKRSTRKAPARKKPAARRKKQARVR